jgi:hypothetical protein
MSSEIIRYVFAFPYTRTCTVVSAESTLEIAGQSLGEPAGEGLMSADL